MKIVFENINKFFSKDNYVAATGIKNRINNIRRCNQHHENKDIHKNSVVSVHGGAIYTLGDYTFAIKKIKIKIYQLLF